VQHWQQATQLKATLPQSNDAKSNPKQKQHVRKATRQKATPPSLATRSGAKLIIFEANRNEHTRNLPTQGTSRISTSPAQKWISGDETSFCWF
jgi:hypothetical protein